MPANSERSPIRRSASAIRCRADPSPPATNEHVEVSDFGDIGLAERGIARNPFDGHVTGEAGLVLRYQHHPFAERGLLVVALILFFRFVPALGGKCLGNQRTIRGYHLSNRYHAGAILLHGLQLQWARNHLII